MPLTRSAPLPARIPAAVLLALALTLGACSGNGEEPAGDTAEPTEDYSPPDVTVPESAGVVLSREGLAVAGLGEDAEAALGKLRAAMGEPNALTKWLPATHSLWGDCPGEELRGAKWGDLWVVFSDSTELSAQRHLFGWMLGQAGVYGRTGLKTAEGIGVGSTVAEVRAAYGERVSFSDYELGSRFVIAPEDGQDAGPRQLVGSASGADDDDQVRALRGGLLCEE